MGYDEWTEDIDVQVGVDSNGNPITVKQEVKYYKITCDNCGKVIVDTSKGIVGAYYTVGSESTKKYYCEDCYAVLRAKGEL